MTTGSVSYNGLDVGFVTQWATSYERCVLFVKIIIYHWVVIVARIHLVL